MKVGRNIFPRCAIFRIAVAQFFALLLCLATQSYAALPADGQACAFEAAYSPHGGSLSLVLKTIDDVQKSIHVAAYSFTSKPVATALLAAQYEKEWQRLWDGAPLPWRRDTSPLVKSVGLYSAVHGECWKSSNSQLREDASSPARYLILQIQLVLINAPKLFWESTYDVTV